MKEVKKIDTYAKVVKKPQFGGGHSSKKPRIEVEPSSRSRVRKKQKSKLDEAMKSGKIEGTYEVVSLITLKEIIDEVLKDFNLKNVPVYYENFDDKDQKAIDEAIFQYMNVYSKALIELSTMIPKSLYDILDAQRHTTSLEDERIKECVLVNLSFIIYKEEVFRLLKLAKQRFRSKKRVNKLMLGKIDEVTKEFESIFDR